MRLRGKGKNFYSQNQMSNYMKEDSFLSQVIDFIEKNGGRYIVAENGRPEFVIMSTQEYQKLLNKGKTGNFSKKDTKNESLNKANYELALLREEALKDGDSIFLKESEKNGNLTSKEDIKFTPSEIESFKNKEEFKEPEVEDLPF